VDGFGSFAKVADFGDGAKGDQVIDVDVHDRSNPVN
jgi:hypothetical protein